MAIDLITSEKISRNRMPRPFLKWVGGKSQILHELRKSYPKSFNRFYEPFLGGGAVFFDLLPSNARISDTNKELTDCFIAVKSRVDDLIAPLKQHVYDRKHFYKVREHDPKKLDKMRRAARMIYLNRAGFNGLYRVNSKGKFNVPFGRYKNPLICDEDNLRSCSSALEGVEIKRAPFESVLDHAKPGDFVYFDPPYFPVSDTAYFTAYQKGGFFEDDQKRLAGVFDELSARSIFAMLSNSDVPWIHKHYKRHNIRVIKARRLINSNANRRGPVSEVIVTNY